MTSKRNKWNNSKTIQFLQMLETYEPLWNVRHRDYTSKKKREEVYECLLRELIDAGLMDNKCDTRILRAKIKSLRDAFRQEVTKVNTSKLMAKSPEDIYEPKLAWYDNARFWIEFIGTRPIFGGKSDSTCASSNDTSVMKIDIDEENENLQPISEFLEKPEPMEERTPESPQEDFLEPELSAMNYAYDETPDACACFGNYVAAELRSLPVAKRMKLQQEIQNCISATVIGNADETILRVPKMESHDS